MDKIARIFYDEKSGLPISIVIHEPQRKVWKTDFDNVIFDLTEHGYIIKKKIKKTCSRCGGSGKYSSCTRYGTVCFQCFGKKYVYVDVEE